MPIATVTSKGQITIPLAVRAQLGIHTGTRVQFVTGADGIYDFIPATGSIMDLAGVLKDAMPPMTLEEMDAAIAEHLTAEDARSRRP
ncbi:MAG: AbrB/MazE/SpoVT family DNA-binding domain-containing protein [Pseudolysinimonas sp.]|uniref:AbrB/MazE/SpoVT family DNA-binding domain-containing protein n=1 Tax=Pseudolysinimonas sp. TaxID=2680009 RepID=UPI003263065B